MYYENNLKNKHYLFFVPSMKIISMPEAPLVSFNVANFALLKPKSRFPH